MSRDEARKARYQSNPIRAGDVRLHHIPIDVVADPLDGDWHATVSGVTAVF